MARTAEDEARRNAVQDARKRLKEAEAAYRDAVRSATDGLTQAQRAREMALNEARAQLESATKTYDSKVAEAKRNTAGAERGELLGSLGQVLLFINRLEAPDGTVPLSRDIQATAEVSGEKGKDFDNREVLLLLSTPKFDSVIHCKPTDAVAAREFAAKVNTAAKNAAENLSTYERRAKGWKENEERVVADRSEVEAADAHLKQVEADTQEVDQAQAALDAAIANTSALEERRKELLALDPSAKVKDVKVSRFPIDFSRPLAWWRERRLISKIGLATAGVFVGLMVLGAVIDAFDSEPSTSKPAASKPKLVLTLIQPAGGSGTTTGKTYTVEGTATIDSRVLVNGKVAKRSGYPFSLVVPLRIGENVLRVRAEKSGLDPKTETVTIVRKLPPVQLSLAGRPESVTVRQSTYTIKGWATPGAKIKIAGKQVPLSGNRFELTVLLKQGKNVFKITADKAGLPSSSMQLTVIRRLSAEEIAQQQEARRQTFMNACVTVPYNQLIKNPDAYAGKKVKYYGEIFQIQESGGGGMMLLSVTDLGYDMWTDEIWVDYAGHVRGAEGDKLTVYGIVLGSKSYETKIGGENYVPQIEAVYIVE
jgi:multidrug efflux pump subunit AcrA (membrane-fusion protein)